MTARFACASLFCRNFSTQTGVGLPRRRYQPARPQVYWLCCQSSSRPKKPDNYRRDRASGCALQQTAQRFSLKD